MDLENCSEKNPQGEDLGHLVIHNHRILLAETRSLMPKVSQLQAPLHHHAINACLWWNSSAYL